MTKSDDRVEREGCMVMVLRMYCGHGNYILLSDHFSHRLDIWISSTVIYKFSMRDKKPFHIVSHARQWNSVACTAGDISWITSVEVSLWFTLRLGCWSSQHHWLTAADKRRQTSVGGHLSLPDGLCEAATLQQPSQLNHELLYNSMLVYRTPWLNCTRSYVRGTITLLLSRQAGTDSATHHSLITSSIHMTHD